MTKKTFLIVVMMTAVLPGRGFAQTDVVSPVQPLPPPVILLPDDVPAVEGAAPANQTVSVVPDINSTTTADGAGTPPTLVSDTEKSINEQVSYLNPTIKVDTIPSLFFLKGEYDLIANARRGLKTRPVNAPEDSGIASESNILSGPREIALSGIVYESGEDWVIWLNGKRVAPDAIPSEVMDIKVYKDYIKLEWFDESTNQVYPIKLRTHQRFHLDTRMFLPG